MAQGPVDPSTARERGNYENDSTDSKSVNYDNADQLNINDQPNDKDQLNYMTRSGGESQGTV